jgi:hypothetical protein
VAASKKSVVAVASGVFALAAGIGVAGLASADPTTAPAASPTGAPSAGTDRSGPGHGGSGRGDHSRFDGDLTAKLAEKLGVTEDRISTALKEIRDANKPDQSTKPDPGSKPDPSTRHAELAKALAAELGIDEAKIKTALDEIRAEHTAQRATALKDRLAAAVKAGTLTQAEADAVQKAFDIGVISWR